MKKDKLLLVFITALSAIAFNLAHAYEPENSKEICERWISELHDVHCVYVSGLTNETEEGRYIKEYNRDLGQSYTRCMNSESIDSIYQEDVERYHIAVGVHNIEYSICSNDQGEQCEPIGTDSYAIAKTGEYYTGLPATYTIDLSAVNKKFPACLLHG